MSRKVGIGLWALLVVGGVVGVWRSAPPSHGEGRDDATVAEWAEKPAPSGAEDEVVVAADQAMAEGVAPVTVEGHAGGDVSAVAELRPVVRAVLAGTSYKERLRAMLDDMPSELTAAEYAALRKYLLTPQDGKDGDFRQHEYALRNYMMDALRAQETRFSETISTFSTVYGDEGQGEVMRNYALQHLASVYIDNVGPLSTEEKTGVVAVLRSALDDGQSLTGTALVGLHDISRWDAAVVAPASVAEAAMGLLEDDASGNLSKISAFQISAELGLEAAGPHARRTAFDADAFWVLRMSAVHALGQIGDTGGLDALLNDSNKNVRKAALAALNVKR